MACSAWSRRLGKNCVLHSVAKSSLPLLHSRRAISSVRCGSSWQMRESDRLPSIRCEMVAKALPTRTMRYVAGTAMPRSATAREMSYSRFTASQVLIRALFTLRISPGAAGLT